MTANQKTVIITGAARGIGLASAKLFSRDNYLVAMVDRDKDELLQAASHIKNAKAFICDVSDEAQISQMIEAVIGWAGQIDSLVNNAGVAVFGPMEACDYKLWRTIMETNLDGVFLCSQAAMPYLRKTAGSIVNIASISGLRASSLRIAYGTSKAAVIHLTQQQAAEAGDWGVRVNCICPGPVRTKLAMAVHSQDIIDAYHDAIPLNRYGQEEEIAHAIHFLASDKASYVTGQTLSIDGGFEAMGIGLPSMRKARADT